MKRHSSLISLCQLLPIILLLLLPLMNNAQPTPFDVTRHPARAWSSYDYYPVCNDYFINETEILRQAEALSKFRAVGKFKWVIVDEGWADVHHWGWTLDGYGRPLPSPKLFPSAMGGQGFYPLKKLLKEKWNLDLGIWTIKGIPKPAVEMNLPIKGSPYTAKDIALLDETCVWHWDMYLINASHPGAWYYYLSLMELYLQDYGVTYLKVDCVFGERDQHTEELELIAKAFYHQVPHPNDEYILSFSPGKGTNMGEGDHYGRLANMYRITDDLWDCWVADAKHPCGPDGTSIINQTYTLIDWQSLMGKRRRSSSQPGTLSYDLSTPDPDMLALGRIRLGSPWNKSGGDYHLSHISDPGKARYVYGMWTLTQSPILLGGDMVNIASYAPWLSDMFNNSYLTLLHENGIYPHVAQFTDVDKMTGDGGLVIWTAKDRYTLGVSYIGFFAFSTNPDAKYNQTVSVPFSALNLTYPTQIYSVYDMFEQKDWPAKGDYVNATQPNSHWKLWLMANDAKLLMLTPACPWPCPNVKKQKK